METLILSLFNGLLYGMLLFMLSSGLTLIFGMMGVLNFAHASFYMIGAYLAYTFELYVGFWVALILAPIVVGFLGAGVERYGLRRVHQFGHVPELLFTFGLAYVTDEVVRLLWGNYPVDYRMPEALDFTLFNLFGSHFPAFRVFVLVVAVAMFVALYLLIKKTRVGLVVQASLTRPDIVSTLGHDVPRVFMLVFAVGAALAALGGVVGGIYLITEPGMAAMMGPIVFVVVVLGGLGSVPGALVASILIGVVQSLALAMNVSLAAVFSGIEVGRDHLFATLWYLDSGRIAPMLPFMILIVTLIFRPRGLMGRREA